MHSQLTRALRQLEPFRTGNAPGTSPNRVCVIDFRTSTIDQVIDRVMEMDKMSSWLMVGELERTLPTKEVARTHAPLPMRNTQPQPNLESYTEKTGNEYTTQRREEYTGCLRGKPKLGKKPRQPTDCELSLYQNVQ